MKGFHPEGIVGGIERLAGLGIIFLGAVALANTLLRPKDKKAKKKIS